MRTWLSLLSFAVVGCSGGPESGSDAGTDAGNGSAQKVRVVLSSSKATLMSGESTTFTATVTVLPGAMVATGTLLQGTSTVGSFAKQTDGTWTISSTWAQLAAPSLKGVMDQTFMLPVTARFNDDQGNSGDGSTTVGLGCPPSKGLCGGTCNSMFNDPNNCGGCGFDCTKDFSGPDPGQTALYTSCGFGLCGTQIVNAAPYLESCTTQCATRWTYLGKATHCVAGCDPQASTDFPKPASPYAGRAYYGTDPNTLMKVFYRVDTCDEVPPAVVQGRNFIQVECCCAAGF